MRLHVFVAVGVLNFACGKDNKSSDAGAGFAQDLEFVTSEVLSGVLGQQIIIDVPGVCDDGVDASHCESWLGLTGEQIGLTHITNRLVFSIEDLQPDGSFHLAAYPDCRAGERAAVEENQVPETTVAEGDPESLAPMSSRDWDVDVDGEPPHLSEGEPETTPTPDYDFENFESGFVVAGEPPFPECRQLVVTPVTLGEPVTLMDPTLANDIAWWKIHFPEDGYPMFVSVYSAADIKIRLLLDDDGFLTAVQAEADELALRSLWKKLRGRISKTFNSLENSAADARKSIGKSVNVEKIGGKKLHVVGALPGATLYSAVKEQGSEALSQADGVVRDGVLYFQQGAKYAEEGVDKGLKGAVYIAEYAMANACYLGRMAELIRTFGASAAVYEGILAAGAKSFAEDLRDAFSVENMVKDKNSPTYLQVMLAVKAYALYASFQSRKFGLAQWEGLLYEIIFSILGGKVQQGFTPKIMSRVARAMCSGTEEALSSAHALVSTPSTNGISDNCLEQVRNAAMSRYEGGDDICYAMRAEINKAAQAAPKSNKVIDAWAATGAQDACPSDPSSESYLNLLEGVGCALGDNIASGSLEVGDVAIDASTVLTPNHRWGRSDEWRGSIHCPSGHVAIGMCASGSRPDCYKKTKELLCASHVGGAIVNNRVFRDVYKQATPDMAFCPNDYVVTGLCTSGGGRDCASPSSGDYTQSMRCSKLSSTLRIDYGGCDLKESRSWQGRLQATKVNHVMVGVCSSGKNGECDRSNKVTKSAVFCPLVRASELAGVRGVFQFFNGKDHMVTNSIGENPYSYSFANHGFNVHTDPGPNRRAIYRCLAGSNHFVSTSDKCEGQRTEALLGYLSSNSGTPVYRCYKDGDHWITTERSDCESNGYRVEGVLGYSP